MENNMIQECESCEYLIERYGFCQVVNDWVEPQLDILSFDWTSFVQKESSK